MRERLTYYIKHTYYYYKSANGLVWLLGIISFLCSSCMVSESSISGQIKPFVTSLTAADTEPSSPCRYDPQSQMYRECFHTMAHGTCAHFGNPYWSADSSPNTSATSPCLYDAES